MVGLGAKLDPDSVRDYDGFHLVLGSPEGVVVWTWDGADLTRVEAAPGDHIIVNLGYDTPADPLVPHFQPLLASAALGPSAGAGAGSTVDFWGSWVGLLRGDDLAPDDPRALIVRRTITPDLGAGAEFVGRIYGSTSASLVALGRDRVRYDFSATPDTPQWTRVL
jgi:hypothetical protein